MTISAPDSQESGASVFLKYTDPTDATHSALLQLITVQRLNYQTKVNYKGTNFAQICLVFTSYIGAIDVEAKWVTFKVGKEIYAFELEHVQEMIRMPQSRYVPQMSHDDLGVALLRNKVVPVVDLAKTLGYTETELHGEALGNLLSERRQDHLDWIHELESCVRENREFKLTLDSTKCKFGVWYSSFKTEDPWLATLLRRMEKPHATIHSLGTQIISCLRDGNDAACAEIIEQHRNTTLKELLDLFDQAIQQVTESTRRILIVLKGRTGPLGIAVDAINTVVPIEESSIQFPDSLPGSRQFEGLIGFAVMTQTGEKIQLLDPVAIYPQLTAEKRQRPEGVLQ